jgi:sucrose-6-phosphate hydrolase SacC (GH32 family)
VQSSLRGETNERINDLRDPDIFVDVDGQVYLLYVAAGEQSIGVVGLNKTAP